MKNQLKLFTSWFFMVLITRGDDMLAKLAQEIANITSEVIGHDVLTTDKDGMVLGSSDKSRIGKVEEPLKR